jgi:hypothetical protein
MATLRPMVATLQQRQTDLQQNDAPITIRTSWLLQFRQDAIVTRFRLTLCAQQRAQPRQDEVATP